MKEKELFPDYEPKRTSDTINDYLRTSHIVHQVLSKIGDLNLENLKTILVYFTQYEKEAIKHPGGVQKGNVAIGANLDQYYPSEEELLVSELGKIIQNIVISTPKEQLANYKKVNHITIEELSFYEIYFRHVDVMGSGRFFYAEKSSKKTIVNL